jgi:hypothetical protein
MADLGRGLWARPSKIFFQYSKKLQICKFKFSASVRSKIIQTLHEAIFEYIEQLYQLGQLQIPNKIHDINFGTDSSLNLS